MYDFKDPKTENLKQGIVVQRLNSSSSFDSAQTVPISSLESKVDLSAKESILVEDDSGGSCGWFCFRPKFLQGFRSIKGYLVFICFASLIQGVLVNGFVNVFISTLERRYQLSSTESGIIIGSYDIASFVTVLPISYFGGRPGANKPRWVASGMCLLGIGSLIFALPQFTAGRYVASQPETAAASTCPLPASNETCSEEDSGAVTGSLNTYKYVFILAQLFHGVGAVPLFTLAITFIDDNVSNKMQPLYTGFYYVMVTLGPAIGFVGGGQLLRMYTDFIWISAEEIGITPDSNVWVGAWWLGFLITGFSSIALAIPLFAFPAELPGVRAMAILKERETRELKKKKQVENEANDEEEDDDDYEEVQKMSAAESLRDLPHAIKDLLTNPTFVFLCLATAGEAFVVAGYGGFLPKYVESAFGVPASQAALIVGVVIVPAGVIGTVFGGYIIKRFRLRCFGTLRLCIAIGLCEMAFTLCFLVYCPEPNLAGVNFSYSNASEDSAFNMTDACNLNCGCSLEVFDPVCGADNVMYHSPCFAGCSTSSGSGALTVFNNCSCIDAPPRNITLQGKNITLAASRQKCKTGCNNLILFIALLLCFLLFKFLLTMPAMSAVLRCVPSKRRSFALGVQTIVYRLLGSIPGPIVFGSLIDGSCRLWGQSCDGPGSCNFYDNLAFSRAMMWPGLGTCGFSLSVIILAYFTYRPPGHTRRTATTLQTENCKQEEGGCDNPGFEKESK